MATTAMNQTISTGYTERVSKPSVFTQFMNWCKGQQENRLLWIGIILAGHGCIITPLTVMAVILAGTNLFLFILSLVAMTMALVTNLAAMPTKYTIPVFFFSMLIDMAIVISCAFIGFNTGNAF